MKYEPKRNYLYPVLRPYSDDYESDELDVEVTAAVVGQRINVSVKFGVNEPSIQHQIVAGNARCIAMLYCRDTLYRQMLRADNGKFALRESVPAGYLVNDVEIHPAVVAFDNISHPTKTAHPEYGGAAVKVGKFQPLATAQTWRFSVNADSRPTKSIFNLDIDDELPSDVFNIVLDTSDRYIKITANKHTSEQFQRMREDETQTIPTVYMNALMNALAYIKYNDLEEDGGDDSGAWVSCIRNNLMKKGIRIGDSEDDGSHTLFYAAQILLENPFGDLLHPDYYEEELE